MKKGISLIVLIITIIVMIIIAGAVIMTLSSSDIIDKASIGKGNWNEAAVKENLEVLAATNLAKVNYNGKDYRAVNMLSVLEALNKLNDIENIKITAIKVPGSTALDGKTEEEIINFYFVSEYSVRMYEEIKEYTTILQGTNPTVEDVQTYLNNLAAKYEADALKYQLTIVLDRYNDYSLPFHKQFIDAIIQGNNNLIDEYLIIYRNASAAVLYESNLGFEFNMDGKKYEVRDAGETGEVIFTIDADGVITGCVGEIPENIVIPSTVTGITVTGIAANTFKDNLTIKSLEVGNLPSFSVGESAFEGCTGLESISFGADNYTIGSYAFKNCSELTNIYLYINAIPSLSSGLFDGCTGGNTKNITISGKRVSSGQPTNEQLGAIITGMFPTGTTVNVSWQQ